MQHFDNASAGDIVLSIADRIIENRAYLSEIDGKIGDGDHGVNMAKGFGMAAERIRGNDVSLATALDTLGTVLMTEIGGSMGPLYGVMFTQFAETIETSPSIDAKTFSAMLTNGLEGVQAIGSAKVGDKTLLDTLVPAIEAFDGANADGKPFPEA
ncbi:DAK2 domain-containing protein, partial [Mesorhizobium sp. M7A.F.Ca.MR.362.00.0.0]